jgi:hypothetical protein
VSRPTSDVVGLKVAELYASPGGAAGCCLHVQLDDDNLADRFFDDEARARINPEHALCLELFDLLRAMKRTARAKAAAKR